MPARRLTAALVRLLRFARAERGAAAVEFALVLPVMLTLYLGSTELSQLIVVDRRVTVVAGTVGDLVARANGSLTASDLTDYFQAAQNIMGPYPTSGLKQSVTFVQVSATGTTTVKWSRGYNGGTAKTVGASYTLPTQVNAISRGSYVVVAEASYSYTPLLGLFFKNAVPLYRQNFYAPRFGDYITYPG